MVFYLKRAHPPAFNPILSKAGTPPGKTPQKQLNFCLWTHYPRYVKTVQITKLRHKYEIDSTYILFNITHIITICVCSYTCCPPGSESCNSTWARREEPAILISSLTQNSTCESWFRPSSAIMEELHKAVRYKWHINATDKIIQGNDKYTEQLWRISGCQCFIYGANHRLST